MDLLRALIAARPWRSQSGEAVDATQLELILAGACAWLLLAFGASAVGEIRAHWRTHSWNLDVTAIWTWSIVIGMPGLVFIDWGHPDPDAGAPAWRLFAATLVICSVGIWCWHLPRAVLVIGRERRAAGMMATSLRAIGLAYCLWVLGMTTLFLLPIALRNW